MNHTYPRWWAPLTESEAQFLADLWDDDPGSGRDILIDLSGSGEELADELGSLRSELVGAIQNHRCAP